MLASGLQEDPIELTMTGHTGNTQELQAVDATAAAEAAKAKAATAKAPEVRWAVRRCGVSSCSGCPSHDRRLLVT